MDLSNIACELDTKDLHLRRIAVTDAEAMFTMLADQESMKYWSSPPVSDISDALEVLQQDVESDAKGNSICWAVTLNETGEMIGKCILFQFSHANRRAEIGFILNRKYWRRGLMTQALQAVLHYAFNTLKLHRIEADVDPDNAGSLGVLEKLGFKREGLFHDRWLMHDEWVDSVMLGLLNPET